MARTMTAMQQYKLDFCRQFRRHTVSVHLSLSKTFVHLADNTKSTVDRLEKKTAILCFEHDRIALHQRKSFGTSAKADMAFKKARQKGSAHIGESADKDMAHHEERNEVLYVVSAVKRSSSGVRNRLKNHVGWVGREICVDKDFVGWFTPWKAEAAAMPTGGVQTALIEAVDIEVGPHALGCPEETVVVIRRLPKLSSGALSRAKVRGKAWYFGFKSRDEAEKLVMILREKTNMQGTDRGDGVNDESKDSSGSARKQIVNDMIKESKDARKMREKRDEAHSYHLFMQHVATLFAKNEYTSSTRWAARALNDMQAQRQLFSHSVLKLLTEERDRLSQALHGTAGDFNTFVATVDPPQLLQSFIITIMSKATTALNLQSELSQATGIRSSEDSF
jgi:hypothetical protein